MLSKVLRGQAAAGGDGSDAIGELVEDRGAWEGWRDRWLAALSGIPAGTRPEDVATSMDAVNPAYPLDRVGPRIVHGRGEEAPRSVSYTHLDVYKRQHALGLAS